MIFTQQQLQTERSHFLDFIDNHEQNQLIDRLPELHRTRVLQPRAGGDQQQ